MSSASYAHIPRRQGTSKTWCGAPYRKPTTDRRQECPQCKRVRKRESEGE